LITVAAVACSFTPRSASSENAAPGDPEPKTVVGAIVQGSQANVTRLYEENCAKCHGQRGEGGGGGTRTLLTRAKYDQGNDRPFFDAIKNGVHDMGMPAYGATLSDPEIWSLVVHIRELQAKDLRQTEGSPKPENGVYKGQRRNYRVETVIDRGLDTPWALDWLPDGRMLVTNRPGSMVVVKDGKIISTVSGLPAVVDNGQGGLMDVSVHPDYAKNGWIYLSFSDPKQGGGRETFTKVVRGKIEFSGDSAAWKDQHTIWEAGQENYNRSGIHFGNKIVFDRKGHVFFSVGERGSGEKAQDLSMPNGKIYRVNEDGTIPSDNPFPNSPIWTYGHRNPQGLVIDLDGTLWDTEHAPRGGDELNRIQKGNNYGWPIISFGINYNDSPLVVPWPTADQKFTMPVFRWLPSVGTSGLDVVRGNAFPEWKGDLVAGGLSGQNLDRFRIKDDKVVDHEELIQGQGRVREVAVAPDGTIYVALNGPDKIIRLVP
jgi:glucose/arabinose dehydrogenase